MLIKDSKEPGNFNAIPSAGHVIRDLPACVYWKSRGGLYLGCNNVFLNMIGVNSEQDVIGKTDYDFSWKKDADMLRRHDEFVMKSREIQTLEEEVTLASGERRLYSVVKSPLFDEHNKNIIGVAGTSIDITDRKRLEEILAETQLREAHFKAMSALGGIMAHELKTPLMSIALNAKSVKAHFPIFVKAYREYSKIGKIPSICKRHLEILEKIAGKIELSARYASNTINTILSGFRYSASTSISVEAIEVNEIIQRALDDYPLSQADRSLITFCTMENCKVLGAPNIIVHVMHNLLKNALYAIQSVKKGVISISLEKADDGSVRLRFQDTAKGIPKEILKHIFDAFYTTKDSETSTGLGLYFCRMALEKMNASITCQSEVGKYTVFTVVFKGLTSENE